MSAVLDPQKLRFSLTPGNNKNKKKQIGPQQILDAPPPNIFLELAIKKDGPPTNGIGATICIG